LLQSRRLIVDFFGQIAINCRFFWISRLIAKSDAILMTWVFLYLFFSLLVFYNLLNTFCLFIRNYQLNSNHFIQFLFNNFNKILVKLKNTSIQYINVVQTWISSLSSLYCIIYTHYEDSTLETTTSTASGTTRFLFLLRPLIWHVHFNEFQQIFTKKCFTCRRKRDEIIRNR
jgi:hypothetical protein